MGEREGIGRVQDWKVEGGRTRRPMRWPVRGYWSLNYRARSRNAPGATLIAALRPRVRNGLRAPGLESLINEIHQ